MQDTNISFERKSSVLTRYGCSKATLHKRINNGEFPPSVQIGANSVAFLRHEVNAVIAGLALGVDMKQLVADLVAKRSELKSQFIDLEAIN